MINLLSKKSFYLVNSKSDSAKLHANATPLFGSLWCYQWILSNVEPLLKTPLDWPGNVSRSWINCITPAFMRQWNMSFCKPMNPLRARGRERDERERERVLFYSAYPCFCLGISFLWSKAALLSEGSAHPCMIWMEISGDDLNKPPGVWC